MKPIFLLVSERSGSNLLRTLLGNHSAIAGPKAPHFFTTFNSFIHLYGNLRNEKNRERLFRDMKKLANIKLYNWKFNADFTAFNEKYRPKTFFDFIHGFYMEKSLAAGKKTYIAKENDLFDYAHIITSKFPSAKWIYL